MVYFFLKVLGLGGWALIGILLGHPVFAEKIISCFQPFLTGLL